MQKVVVVLLKNPRVHETKDLNKLQVHLQRILEEKDGVDFKLRTSLTEPAIKSADFVIFCGYDCLTLSEFFKAAAIAEVEKESGPMLFLYDEPGDGIIKPLNEIFVSGANCQRISPNLYSKVIDCWSYRDIIGYVDSKIKKLESEALKLKSSEESGTN